MQETLFLNGTLKDWYGIVCLALGSVLVVGAVIAGFMEAKKSSQVNEQAKAVSAAAKQVKEAAASAAASVSSVNVSATMGALALPAQAQSHVETSLNILDSVRQTAEQAGEAADAAQTKAEEAASYFSVLNTVASKTPLAAAGILIIILGAMLMGYVEINFGGDG